MNMQIKRIIATIAPAVLFVPALAFAADGPVVSFRLIPENVEAWIGLVLLAVSVIAAIYALKVSKLFGGALGKTWKLLTGVAITFAFYQILLSLEELEHVEFGGVDELLEILITIFLFAAFYKAYTTLKGQIKS